MSPVHKGTPGWLGYTYTMDAQSQWYSKCMSRLLQL